MRLALCCGALAILAGCSGGHGPSYVGEDTAYYLSHAQGNYAPPGPPGDPWGPYIRIAAARYDVPQMWIRQVMRVESGGHEYSDGQLIVSDAGAMGLMQLEPGTYQEMAERYGLENDPFNPLDNILAGTAYIHEMYRIYGCPGFLAAYNAGPGRLDSYINDRRPLPLQTINYVDMIAPNIDGYYPNSRSPADELALNTEPMGEDGGLLPSGFQPEAPTPAQLSAPVEVASLSPVQAAYSNDSAPVTVPVSEIMPQVAQIRAAHAQPVPPPMQPMQTASISPLAPVRVASNNSMVYVPRPAPPTQVAVAPPPHVMMASATPEQIPHPPYNYLTLPPPNQTHLAVPQPSATPPAPVNVAFNSGQRSWGIQVGAFDTPSNARAALGMAELSGANILQKAEPIVMRISVNGGTFYRARFVGLEHTEAVNACNRLSSGPTGCVILSPDEQS